MTIIHIDIKEFEVLSKAWTVAWELFDTDGRIGVFNKTTLMDDHVLVDEMAFPLLVLSNDFFLMANLQRALSAASKPSAS